MLRPGSANHIRGHRGPWPPSSHGKRQPRAAGANRSRTTTRTGGCFSLVEARLQAPAIACGHHHAGTPEHPVTTLPAGEKSPTTPMACTNALLTAWSSARPPEPQSQTPPDLHHGERNGRPHCPALPTPFGPPTIERAVAVIDPALIPRATVVSQAVEDLGRPIHEPDQGRRRRSPAPPAPLSSRASRGMGIPHAANAMTNQPQGRASARSRSSRRPQSSRADNATPTSGGWIRAVKWWTQSRSGRVRRRAGRRHVDG